MKKLLIIGLALAFVLSAGTAMAASDQASDMFQTLGTMSSGEQIAVAPLTGQELDAIEGKSRKVYRYTPRHRGHKNYKYVKIEVDLTNKSKVRQSNSCTFCGNGNGGFNGGNANLGVIQSNSNQTQQSIF